MKIGYILKTETGFIFKEDTFTRIINSCEDKIHSKMLRYPFNYEEVVERALIMKEEPDIIFVNRPFLLLDDELRDTAIKWVEWANKVGIKYYDLFEDWKSVNQKQ